MPLRRARCGGGAEEETSVIGDVGGGLARRPVWWRWPSRQRGSQPWRRHGSDGGGGSHGGVGVGSTA
jgi:hypothetical protein